MVTLPIDRDNSYHIAGNAEINDLVYIQDTSGITDDVNRIRLQDGDLLWTINGHIVRNLEGAKKLIASSKGKPITMVFRRRRRPPPKPTSPSSRQEEPPPPHPPQGDNSIVNM